MGFEYGLTTRILAQIDTTFTKTFDDKSKASEVDNMSLAQVIQLTTGESDGEANFVHHIQFSLVQGTPVVIGMFALYDPLGNQRSPNKIRAIMIVNTSSACDLKIKPAAASSWSSMFNGVDASELLIRKKGLYMLASGDADGYVVTSGTQNLEFVHLGNAGDPDIVVKIVVVGVDEA